MSAAYGLKSGQSDRERNFGLVSQIDVFILVLKSEYRRKAFYRFLLIKKTERSDSTLRNSAVRYSVFCGSLFNPGHPSDPSNHQKTEPFWRSFIRSVRISHLWFLTPET
jgi:hypothetical protein